MQNSNAKRRKMPQSNLPLALAITGASGAVYGTRLLEVLLDAGREVHLTISPSGAAVIKQELDRSINIERFDANSLLPETIADLAAGQLHYHHYTDYFSPLASGSFLTGGMVVCPCSGSTLSGIAHGASNNLIQRAADVHIKERRKLVLVPRETPLSIIHLDNMRRAAEAGAVILPASPGWYHGVQSAQDLIDFVVARILDQLSVPHQLMKRWGS
jgi:4-hydroxy-3-polyprenylbenzoate decarboxylase